MCPPGSQPPKPWQAMCFVLGRSTEFDCELGGTNYILKRGATNQSEINSYISYILGVWFITGSIVFESHMFWVLARLKSDELRCCLLLFSGWRNFSIFGAKTQQLVNTAQWTGQSTQKNRLKEADKLPHIWALRINIYQYPIQDIFQKHSLPSHPIPTHP